MSVIVFILLAIGAYSWEKPDLFFLAIGFWLLTIALNKR